MTSSATAELTRLRAEVESANERRSRARDRVMREQQAAGQELARDLLTFRDAIEFRRPGTVAEADRPAERRRLTVALCERILEDEHLVLDALGRNGAALRIEDIRLEAEYREADAALVVARSALAAFEREHGDDLKREADRTAMARLREALNGNSREALRAALP